MKTLLATATIILFAVSCLAQTHAYKIAYNVAQNLDDDDYDVYVMNTDGTGKTNITSNPDVAWTYYAYKDKIFFISDRDACKRCYFLYSMDADGRNVRKISGLRLEDSWMGSRNNGKEMVVTGRIGKDTRYQLFTVDVASGGYQQITAEPGAMHRDPIFSPDGRQIVFSYKKERDNREEFEDLYIMDADGKNRRRLTTYPKDDKTSKWHSYHAGPPHWNRKENFITYQSNQAGKSSLYAVTPDGKKHWKLTDHKLNEGWHDWSPDGKWLAIEMYDKEQTEFGIYLMNYETKELKKLTDPKDFKFQQSPVFVEVPNPAEIVRRYMEAYNRHDIDSMISLVAAEIKWFSIDGANLSTATANAGELRKFLEKYFKHCAGCRSSVSDLSQSGNTVSFVETTAGGQSSLAVYEVIGGKISRVYYFPAFEAPADKFDSGLAGRLGADQYGMKTYVFAILKSGKTKPDKAGRDDLMTGHLKNITRLANEGKLVLAGPFLENDDRRGIFVFDVRTKEEAAELIKSDPAVAAGVFDVELRLWYGTAALLSLSDIYELISEKPIID